MARPIRSEWQVQRELTRAIRPTPRPAPPPLRAPRPVTRTLSRIGILLLAALAIVEVMRMVS